MGTNLRRFSIFKNVSRQNMELLKPIFEPYMCNIGTVILQQGMPADYLYLIISGTVEISYKPYDGHKITVSHVEKGGLFGWSAVVGSEKYTSSAIAIEKLSAVRVHGNDLRKFCTDHPEAGKDILEKLASSVSGRWKNASDQVHSILKNGMKKS